MFSIETKLVEQVVTPPKPEDISRLARLRFRAATLVTQHLGRKLSGGDAELDLLQELLDHAVLGREDTYDLQSLGVVFGMCLVDAIEGLDWAIVEDEYRRDPALRYLDTSLLLFPLTMISKRVEDGIDVDVRSMFEELQVQVAELKDQVWRPH
jgi:hypothetical protein